MNTRGLRQTSAFLIALIVICLVQAPQWASAAALKQEQLEQLLAPIALYPDPLVSQILMASTYPLEIVQAERLVKQNPGLKGNTLAKALEAQRWDPSIKSLINFPEVLSMMSEKLDWTQKLGDAFLEQQDGVMAAIQTLRSKAKSAGHLNATKEQQVIVEQTTIRIEPANPQVVYVPAYDPTIVYGAWPYPAYPPYYYPPAYGGPATGFAFASGVVLGAAWGYAWGHCDWNGGDVNINVNQNASFNRNIDRESYRQQLEQKGGLNRDGHGTWQHDPEHRKGVAYGDQATAQKFNRAGTPEAVKSREPFRGRAEQGRQQLARAPDGDGAGPAGRAGNGDRSGVADRGGALHGIDHGGAARTFSERGSASRRVPVGAGRAGGAAGGRRR